MHEPKGTYKSAIQREVAERLRDDDVSVYLEERLGAGVVASFRRFLETEDSDKINEGLYSFLTMRCAFIAHFDLAGFRQTYREPLDLINGAHDGYPLSREPAPHTQYVYTDGMTSAEVWQQMQDLIAQHRARLTASRAERTEDAELRLARELAAKHGMKVVAA